MFLTQELPCVLLPGADFISLASIDMPDGNGTFADHVDQGDFEHIRLKFEECFSLDVVVSLVERYYQEVEYVIERSQKFDPEFHCVVVSLLGKRLGVILVAEDPKILNVSVSSFCEP